MEAKRTELKGHATNITTVLGEVCKVSQKGPLVLEQDLLITISYSESLSRRVTTDLGGGEHALRLPIPAPERSRYWIGLHEQWKWKWKSKTKICFHDCGLRLYVGREDEDVVQVLRLEWKAPEVNAEGETVYDGKYAGHPHWHIDRSALIGPEDYWHSLEIQTAPAVQMHHEPETFNENTISQVVARPIHDCSWLQQLHLPAQAGWMQSKWNGSTVPGPHQSEPTDLAQLDGWWNGALRYLVSELRKAG